MPDAGDVFGLETPFGAQHVIHCVITAGVRLTSTGLDSRVPARIVVALAFAGHVARPGFRHERTEAGKPYSVAESTYSNN